MRAWVAIGLALAGCHSTAAIDLPAPGEHRSALVVIGDPAEGSFSLHAIAFEPDVEVSFSLAETDSLHVLYYRATLDDLGITPGVQTPRDEALSRRLPIPDEQYVADADRKLNETDDITEVLEKARLPAVSRAECSAAGCVRVDVSGAEPEALCQIPCGVEPAVAEPPMPEPAVLTPCPAGWEERPPAFDDDVAHCVPPARRTCSTGTVQFVGATDCADLGDCSDDRPGTLPTGSPVLHVDDDAAPNGDGSELSPLDDLEAAINGAPDGAVIALRAGNYTFGSVAIDKRISIAGNCARQAVVNGRFGVSQNGELVLASLAVAASVPVSATGGEVRLTDVELRATGHALQTDGTNVTLERVSVAPGAARGIRAIGAGATLTATDLVVRERQQIAIRVIGSDVSLSRTVIDGVDGMDGTIDVRGLGLFADGGDVSLTESYVVNTRNNPIAIWNSPDASLTDVYVDHTVLPGAGESVGLDLHRRTTVSLERVNVVGDGSRGVWIFGATDPITATLTNVRVVGANHGCYYFGELGTITADRILAADCGGTGLSTGFSTSTLTNFTIVDTRNSDRGADRRYVIAPNAVGIRLLADSKLTASRGLFRRIGSVAMEVGDEALTFDDLEDLDLSNVTIEDAQWGGVHTYRGVAKIDRIVMRNVGMAGVLAYGRPLDATNVIIEDVFEQTIAPGPDFAPSGITEMRKAEVRFEYDDRNGSGIAVGGFGNLYNGVLTADRIRVTRPASAGVHIANNSQTTLTNIEVVDAPVGEDVAQGGKTDVDGLYLRDVDTELVEP